MPIKVIISGGGTGGHVFPAIAIANALKKINNKIQIKFIGAENRLEMEKVPEAGYEIEGLWISGVQRDNFFKNLALPFKIIFSLIKARRIIKQFDPDVMVGVGGYASGPAMFVAYNRNIPVVIQEQNSYAGVTNKMMARRADKFCVAYDGMDKFFPEERIIKTGNPVRQDIAFLKSNKAESLKHYGFSPEKKTVLVVGGSLGARTINESIRANANEFHKNNIQVIWQTGKLYFDEMTKAPLPDCVKVMPFIREMGQAYDAADVIISRAGALAISELYLIGKPIILVPSPNVAEDHQTKNALALVAKEAALMIKDKEAKQKLVQAVISLLDDTVLQKKLGTNISKLGIPNAAELIAKEILSLL